MKREVNATVPVFSIVMPVYNAEKYLEHALDSIRNQDFSDFELILVNDSSVDNSLAVCFKYAAIDQRITVIDCKTNCGAAVARNRGIKAAKGTYLCFVDADDYIDRDFLQQFYDALQEDEYDLVKSGAYEEYYDKEDLVYSRKCMLQHKNCQGLKEITEQVIDMEQIPLFGYIWNSVYKMSIIRAHNLWFDKTLTVNEDFAFNVAYLPFVSKMKCLSYCGYHYAKRNNTSLSSQQKNYDFEKHLLKVRSFLLLLKQNQMETQAMLDNVYWMFTRFTFSALEAGTALETVRKEPIFTAYQNHRFGPVGSKKKLLTGILQSNKAFLIKPTVGLMRFVKQHLPVLFAKVKK